MTHLLKWDQAGERLYETGVDRGVLYVQGQQGTYPEGEAWNGLTAVTENPTGAEPTPLYADNIKYLELQSVEEFGCTIEAYTYPESFEECDGSVSVAKGVSVGQQPRKAFGFSYRTKVGNDTEGEDHGYKLHIVYGGKASPSDKAYETINDSPDVIVFSWDVTTTPVEIPNHKPSASITIDSRRVKAEDLEELETILYGVAAVEGESPSNAVPARLPTPAEIIEIFKEA